MANRSAAPTHLKMSRSQKILALVPKVGAKSDVSSDESLEDELNMCRAHTPVSNDTSPVRSLASSIEYINLSDSDSEYRDVFMFAEASEDPRPISAPSSPSVLQNSPDVIPPLPALYIPPSPSVDSNNCSPASSTAALEHMNLATPSTVIRPPPLRVGRLRKTRPVVIVRKKIQKPDKMAPKWINAKFLGTANIDDFISETAEHAKSPLDYFKLFFSDDILEFVVHQTNLYSVQKKGTSINVTKDQIRDFLAINILMGVVNMPAYTDYWSKELKYAKIADVMTLKRFQSIRRYLHFNDSLNDNGDRYYKIRPLVEKLRRNCADKISEGNRFSIDEMMVPYKGTRAGSRKQYIKNKPKKWGFKLFVRAAPTGLVHDFIIYGGEDTFRYHRFSEKEEAMGLGAKVVIALAKSIKQKPCCALYFDNFFTSIELIHYLRDEYGIFSLGTIRANRLRGAEKKLPSDKVLKKKGKGAFAQVVSNKEKISVVKWFDNKFVLVASSYADAHPIQVIQRYKEEKKKGPVQCPKLIKEYNTFMGGVDLADMLVALYRTELKGHRWYLPLFSQMLDICVNNAWLLYRRDNSAQNKMRLKQFRGALFRQLCHFERSSPQSQADEAAKAAAKLKKPVAERPDDAIRYDQVGHLPTFTTKGRCRNCTKNQTKFYCQKCKSRLCLVEGRNCFFNFHTSK